MTVSKVMADTGWAHSRECTHAIDAQHNDRCATTKWAERIEVSSPHEVGERWIGEAETKRGNALRRPLSVRLADTYPPLAGRGTKSADNSWPYRHRLVLAHSELVVQPTFGLAHLKIGESR